MLEFAGIQFVPVSKPISWLTIDYVGDELPKPFGRGPP